MHMSSPPMARGSVPVGSSRAQRDWEEALAACDELEAECEGNGPPGPALTQSAARSASAGPPMPALDDLGGLGGLQQPAKQKKQREKRGRAAAVLPGSAAPGVSEPDRKRPRLAVRSRDDNGAAAVTPSASAIPAAAAALGPTAAAATSAVSVSVVTWNCRCMTPMSASKNSQGEKVDNRRKVPDTLKLLPDTQPDIVCLQEVHLLTAKKDMSDTKKGLSDDEGRAKENAERIAKAAAQLPKYTFHYEHGSFVAICVRKDSALAKLGGGEGKLWPTHDWDKWQRVSVWECDLGVVVNVYHFTPNKKGEGGNIQAREELDAQLKKLLRSLGDRLIACVGDLNVTREFRDSSVTFGSLRNTNDPYTAARIRFERMLEEVGLADAWREEHPDEDDPEQTYTSYQTGGSKATGKSGHMTTARVDYILVPRSRFYVRGFELSPCKIESVQVMNKRGEFLRERTTAETECYKWCCMRSDHLPVFARMVFGHESPGNVAGAAAAAARPAAASEWGVF